MCCLTITRDLKGRLVITHNRDESFDRQLSANHMALTTIGNETTLMPIDPISQGTWIGTNGRLTAAILNGYKVKHVKLESYRASRGSLIPTLLDLDSVEKMLATVSFEGLEPFTLVVYDREQLHEVGWDGDKLHHIFLDDNLTAMYSSCTLYNDDMMKNRKEAFNQWLKSGTLDAEHILAFHQKHGDDPNKYINVHLTNCLGTVAITQVLYDDISTELYYEVLTQEGGITKHALPNYQESYI